MHNLHSVRAQRLAYDAAGVLDAGSACCSPTEHAAGTPSLHLEEGSLDGSGRARPPPPIERSGANHRPGRRERVMGCCPGLWRDSARVDGCIEWARAPCGMCLETFSLATQRARWLLIQYGVLRMTTPRRRPRPVPHERRERRKSAESPTQDRVPQAQETPDKAAVPEQPQEQFASSPPGGGRLRYRLRTRRHSPPVEQQAACQHAARVQQEQIPGSLEDLGVGFEDIDDDGLSGYTNSRRDIGCG
ncbi:hypothetical protein BCR34DRAFT_588018 [Clohesyomyces aquaticus]|uniref:Uncharacterized protein n=1 Tax=Clohesyomyces aquaticus TaxID=1231657 RepID=A0A1Y1ZLR3_9PLEO|nr:hypothetical protein BCR34DRAFT_588018 [Clohesyomyces aquaticus]